MHAAVLRVCGEPPRTENWPEPEPADDHVLVRVTAAPVVPLDLLCASGTSYFGAPAVPYVPGVQGVGTTPEGRRVWFTTDAGIHPGDGSYAEVCAVPRGRMLELPDGVEDSLAAALGLSGVAAVGALRRGEVAAGETVAVLGANGIVGQVAVQMARVMGAGRVVAVVRSASAAERLTDLDADAVVRVDGMTLDEMTAAISSAAGGGIDVVVDPVWGTVGQAAYAALRPAGRQVNLGDSAGPEITVSSASLRSRWVELRGYTNLSQTWEQQCAALLAVLEQARAGRIRLQYDTLPLADAEQGWRVASEPGRSTRVVLRP
jgi:NADPH:quinone reductase-like Zn-dependent oxidoreductase